MSLKLKDAGTGGKSSTELNFLGEGTYLEGTIETKGSLRIDGKVKGNVIVADMLTVGNNGTISGEIQAREAVIGGRIEGNIKTQEKLVLEASSTLIGNLETKKLVIDEGAVFQGKSEMGAVSKERKFQEKKEDKGGSKQKE